MKDSPLLPLFVSLCHLPIFFLHFNAPKPKPLPQKKIHVNTIHLLEEPSYQIQKRKTEVATLSTPKPSPPSKKSTPKKKVTKKKTVKQKPKRPKKKTVSKKKLQKNLNKSLSKRKIASKKPAKKATGKGKKTAKKDAGKAQSEYNTYLSKIAEILTDNLTLPEAGKVKLSITIRPNGRVVKIVALLSESAANLSYLEDNLSNIQLPSYTKQEDRTFTIVFSDEK